MIKSKIPNNVINFLEEIKNELEFICIMSDNGREFKNQMVKEWCRKNQVKHEFSIPYYHQSNGRVERANKTLRDAIRKTQGRLSVKLKEIVANYNNTRHRGIGMTPNQALLEENWQKVREIQLAKQKLGQSKN